MKYIDTNQVSQELDLDEDLLARGLLIFGVITQIIIEQSLIHPVSEEHPWLGEVVVSASTIRAHI